MLLNKIIYKFKIKKTLFLLNYDKFITNNLFNKRFKYCIEIKNAIVFANIKVKIYYNLRHTSLLLNSKDKTYLKLNYDYQLLNKFNRKIFSQQCDSFIIKKRVERLAYKLKLLL